MSAKIIDNSQINDIRVSSQFRGVTFSKYKKTDVKIQLVNALKNDNSLKTKIHIE